MVPEQFIKESISLRYIQLIAEYNGYLSWAGPDFGDDIDIKETSVRYENNKKRFHYTGRRISIQLKSTTSETLEINEEQIVYQLRAENYSDLIDRFNNNFPLILVLFILPSTDKNEWINFSDQELMVRKCAYWYIPEDNVRVNTRKTIHIPKANLITVENFNLFFEQFNN